MSAFYGNKFNYKVVAAAQTTAQICGEGGFISTYTVVPASSGGGATALLDGSTTLFTTPVHTGIAGSRPYTLSLNLFATSSEGFKITTGASVSVIVSGNDGSGWDTDNV